MELSKQIEITKKMYKAAEYLLLPLLLINLTVAENRWTVFGFRPEQFIYAVTIGLAVYVGLLSRYRHLVAMMLGLTIVLRLLEPFGGGEQLRQIGFGLLAIVFAVAGAVIYGRKPSLLRKQLVIYLALCIPIMLLQILGASSFVMGWNSEYAHDRNLVALDAVGTFTQIPVYQTLFVGIDQLDYMIGQARPVGLLYSNNVLSIFVCIAVAVNSAITRSSRISFSDIIVTVAIVLTMSKLVLGVTILLYIGFLVFGVLERRRLVLKLIAILAVVMLSYYTLFPGLFISSFSEGMVMSSILLRLVDLIKALGIESSFGRVIELGKAYESNNQVIGEGYSFVATFLRSKLLIPWLFVMMTGLILYVYRLRKMISRQSMVYALTLITCVLTQFAVPFVGTPSFQLIMGFALFPLFKGLWQSNTSYT